MLQPGPHEYESLPFLLMGLLLVDWHKVPGPAAPTGNVDVPVRGLNLHHSNVLCEFSRRRANCSIAHLLELQEFCFSVGDHD